MLRETIIADDAVKLRNCQRDDIELLKGRISILKGAEKLLMKMYFVDGYTMYQIAARAGVTEGTVSRRIKRISQRLCGPLFCAFFENKKNFDTLERRVVRDFLREGLSQRKISAKRKLTRYRVRKAIDKLQSLAF